MTKAPNDTATDRKQTVADLQSRLGESLARETATAEVMRLINASPGDLAPIFETIVDKAMRFCDAGFGGLWLVEGDLARAAATRNLPDAYMEFLTRRPVPQGEAFGPNMKDRPAVHIADLAATELYRRRNPLTVASVELGGIRAYLAVPLRDGNTLAGVLSLCRKEVRPFTDRQIALVQTFADQAVIAIKNARLFNETKEALERQTATADILKVIASSPSDVQPVFKAIAQRSNRLVNGLSTAVYSIIDDVQHLMAFTPVSPEADAALKGFFPAGLSTFIWGETIRKGQVFRIADTEIELAQPAMREMARLRGWRSFVLVPLLRDDEAIGLISVTRVDPGSFVDHDVQLLKTFADQAVIAIENVRLFDEVQAKTRDLEESLQQQTATADVLKAISRSTFDLRTVLDTLTKSAARLCAADSGVIFQRDGNLCRLAANYGFSTEVVRFAVENPLQLDRGSVSGRVILDGKAIHIQDVLTDPEYRATGHQLSAKFRTMLGVPLLREGVTMGSFALTRTEVDPFSEKQIELVTTFADQAVIAIENARLFNEVQERTRELSQSLDDLRAAQDRLIQTEKLASLGQLTAGIAHEIKNPLNFVNNFSALSVELVDEMAELFENPSLGQADRRKELDEIRELLKSNLEKVVQHGKRADSIVKNMLRHSREGSGERRSVDINALVGESLNLAYHGARAEKPGFAITLRHDLDPDAGALELYPQEITRALLNLISNGFYAAVGRKAETDDGAFEPVLSVATRNLGETVEIRIRDNGGGIPPDVKEKMFNPFFTTKPTGEGTGLGLSITHDILVKQHGGRIDVETEPGVFTEFIITLPREKRG